MFTAEQILSQITWKDEQVQGPSLGTLKDLFPGYEMFVVKKSKTDALRASILVKKDGKVTTVVCSEDITPLVRSERLTIEHLVTLPLVFNEKQKTLYIARPGSSWKEIDKITPKEFKPQAVAMEDMI